MWDAKRIADPPLFLDRSSERARLRALVDARDNVLIYGHRRLGKSSLIARVDEDVDATFLYVECNFCDSEQSLGQQILSGLRKTRLARVKQFLDWAREAATGLEIRLQIDGRAVTPVMRLGEPTTRPLEEVLEFTTRIADVAKRPIALVLDEFQAVIKDFPEAVAKLRSHAQRQRSVQYILAGSQPGILLGLTRHKEPFWRQLTEFHVGPIDVDEALKDAERVLQHPIPEAARRKIADFTQGNTQRLAEVLSIAIGHPVLDADAIDAAIDVVLDRHSAGFERILGELTPIQRRLCIQVALLRPDHPTGARFLEASGLKTASHAQRALAALRQKEILDGSRFIDPAFEAWLRRHADAP